MDTVSCTVCEEVFEYETELQAELWLEDHYEQYYVEDDSGYLLIWWRCMVDDVVSEPVLARQEQ